MSSVGDIFVKRYAEILVDQNVQEERATAALLGTFLSRTKSNSNALRAGYPAPMCFLRRTRFTAWLLTYTHSSVKAEQQLAKAAVAILVMPNPLRFLSKNERGAMHGIER